MATVSVETELSTEALLRAVGQLDSDEMAEFALRVMAMRAQRFVPTISEADLVAEISRPLPEDTHRRYMELIDRRDDDRLLPGEHQELLALTEEVEAFDAHRADVLTQLALRKGVPIRDLIRDLGAASMEDV